MVHVWAVDFWPVNNYKMSGAVARNNIEQWIYLSKYLKESLPPKLSLRQPTPKQEVALARSKAKLPYTRGEKSDPDLIPNAIAVIDETEFAQSEDIFLASEKLCFKGRVPDILKTFDLGDAELIKIPSFKADYETPRVPLEGEGDIYTINFGPIKDTILFDQCKGVEKYHWVKPGMSPTHTYVGSPEDREFVFSSEALKGADFWVEKNLRRVKFVSGPLGDALFEVGALTGLDGFTPAKRCEVRE